MATTRDALRARFLLLLAGLLLLIATIGVGCNGGGDDDASSAVSVSAEDVEEQADAAQAQAVAGAEQADAALTDAPPREIEPGYPAGPPQRPWSIRTTPARANRPHPCPTS